MHRPETHAERLPVKAYTTADGLAHNGVNRIVRDSRGLLWFATNDGLSRFDGYAFSNYSVEHGLPHRRVSDLLETRSGELWVATFGGLVRFRPDGVAAERVVDANDPGAARSMFTTIVPATEDVRARALIKLLESGDGTILCGTRNGLFRLHRAGGRFSLQHVDLGLANDHPEQRWVNDLAEDEHGSLWAATPRAVPAMARWHDGAVCLAALFPGEVRTPSRPDEGSSGSHLGWQPIRRVLPDLRGREPGRTGHRRAPREGWAGRLMGVRAVRGFRPALLGGQQYRPPRVPGATGWRWLAVPGVRSQSRVEPPGGHDDGGGCRRQPLARHVVERRHENRAQRVRHLRPAGRCGGRRRGLRRCDR